MSDDLGIKLDRLSARPLFEQLTDALRARILDGSIPPDRKIPTEQALAKSLDVGRSTVIRAVTQLRDEGLLVFVPGRGGYTNTADKIAKAKKRS